MMRFVVSRASGGVDVAPHPRAMLTEIARSGRTSREAWVIDIESLDDLMQIASEGCKIIIEGKDKNGFGPYLLFYDDYIE